MNRPIYTVNCKVKKHQHFVRSLQKSVNKKHSIKFCHNVDNINNHILIVSSLNDSSAKHFLHRPRPYFTGIYIYKYTSLYYIDVVYMHFYSYCIYLLFLLEYESII